MAEGESMASQGMAILRMQADKDRTKLHDARECGPGVPGHSPASNGTALERLLGKCLNDNNAALWAEFVHYSRPLIVTIVVKYLRSAGTSALSAAEDLIQETYLKLFRNDFRALRNFVYRHEGSFYGFLKVVARNVILDYLRDVTSQKRGRSRVGPLDEKSIAKVIHWHGHTGVERKVLLGRIDDFVAETTCKSDTRRDYAIFWLYYRLGLSAKSIARCPSINLTAKGVESAILRLTRQIKGRFNPEAGS